MRLKMLLAALFIAAPAHAQQGTLIDPLDFMVEWPDLIGQKVIITRGRVIGASEQFMLLQLPGGNVHLMPPWRDRDDLRHLFQHCTGLLTGAECDAAVEGTVRANSVGGSPTIESVDFFAPL